MKLSRIEATRYGLLDNACLSGLGDGLTVVLGPNESGKTTFSALTRQVLYGYPDKRTNDRSYLPASGPRAARLVFADDTGTWAIDRIDGPHRGPVTVSAIDGPERAGLLGELVGGVSEQSFRVVFGFGLDELADIERAGTADIVGRLYAAGTGLAVDPLSVKKALEASAADLYAPRASKPTVNKLAAEARDLRDRIRELEDQAVTFADDQRRVQELADEIEPLKLHRDQLDEQVRVLGQDATRLADATAQLEEAGAKAAELQRTIAELERGAEFVDVNDRVLAVAPVLDAVLADASGYRARLEAYDAAQAQADEAERRVKALGALPSEAVDSTENRTALESWAARLAALAADVTAAENAARAAEAQGAATAQVAAEAEPPATEGGAPIASLVSGAITILAGVLVVVAGLLLSHVLVAGLGALVALAGVAVLALALLRPKPAKAGSPLSAEAARLRVDAQAKRDLASSANGAHAAAMAQWRMWLGSRGLDAHGDEPSAVRTLLDELKDRTRLRDEVERFQLAATKERDAAEAWVGRLVDTMRTYDESAAQMPALADAGMLADRAKRDLDHARRADAERSQMAGELAAARLAQSQLVERLDAARAVAHEISARHKIETPTPLPTLESLLERTRDELAQARDRYDQLSREHAGLQARLDEEGRTNAMALARQQLEGLRSRAGQAADRYMVDALAARLLDRARERFERERQPEVVRVAQRVFAEMTGGRYTGLTVPLDNSGITVLASDATRRTSEELSRGTAEQLYLALRVGLITSLGELGRMLPVLMDDVVVNFDPERRASAVPAITRLAEVRQVLYFTCHPETAELLVGAVPGAVLVTLDRCEL